MKIYLPGGQYDISRKELQKYLQKALHSNQDLMLKHLLEQCSALCPKIKRVQMA